MVVIVGKEYEVCLNPDHLDQEEVVVFGMGSDSARRKCGRTTSTRRPPVKDTFTWQTPCNTMAVIEHHCKKSAIIALSWVYKAMVAL